MSRARSRKSLSLSKLFIRWKKKTRIPTLIQLLRQGGYQSVLVFCNYKTSIDQLANSLKQAGLSVDRIHGDLEQPVRERVMARFRNGTTRILVATDVAARGLDIMGLDAVFNFELAKDPDTYIHRIGRTGRAGKSGVAISFWLGIERPRLARLEALLGTPLQYASLKKSEAKPAAQAPHMETLQISGGRKTKLRPGDILGALTGEGCHLPGTAIGKIEIRDNHSFVAVERGSVRTALESLRRGKIKGRRFLVTLVSGTLQ